MKRNKIDFIRVLAVLTIVCAILYFYANIFAPRWIPNFLRIGSIRRPTTLLILGTDITFDAETGKPMPGSDGRTDSILLMRIDPARNQTCILSIPRDSFVEIPGHGWQKINAANVFGGVDLLKQTLTRLTGKNVDYYIKINPYATAKLVDLLGGVTVYIENDMYYVDRAQNLYIDLKKGWHKLSGKEAQGYIRFRHDIQGDIGRIGRQQKLLQIVFNSFARPTNLVKAPFVFEIATKYIETDLPLLKTIRLANFARMLSPSDVLTFTASGENGSDPVVGSIWVLDKRFLGEVLRNYF